jgi:hypothetical protein
MHLFSHHLRYYKCHGTQVRTPWIFLWQSRRLQLHNHKDPLLCRNEMCHLCDSNDIVDKFHYLMMCIFFNNEREKKRLLCIVTEKIDTTYTQIIKYMCRNKISFQTRLRDIHMYYFNNMWKFCKYRCNIHRLPIGTGVVDISRNEMCHLCDSNDIVDKFHYLMMCISEKIDTTYTQIIKYMCRNKISFQTRLRDIHMYYFNKLTQFF